MGLHRAEAVIGMRVAQAAAAAAAALSVGLIALGGPGNVPAPAAPAPASPEPPAPPGGSDDADASAGFVPESPDPRELAARLGVPRQEKPAPDPETVPDAAPDPVPSGADVQFLGAIIEGTRQVALVSLAGTQRLVRAGREVTLPTGERIKVVGVEGDALTVEEGGVRRTIAKSSPQGRTLVTSRAAPPAVTGPTEAGMASAEREGIRRGRNIQDMDAIREQFLRDRDQMRRRWREEFGNRMQEWDSRRGEGNR